MNLSIFKNFLRRTGFAKKHNTTETRAPTLGRTLPTEPTVHAVTMTRFDFNSCHRAWFPRTEPLPGW